MISEELGYVGFAADIYGAEVGSVEDQDTRIELVTLYRSNNTLFYGRIQAAVDVVKNHPDVMPDKIAVIGCKSINFMFISFTRHGVEPIFNLKSFC